MEERRKRDYQLIILRNYPCQQKQVAFGPDKR